MNRYIIALTLLIVSSPLAFANDIELPHVTVFGTATTSVAPDKLIWQLNIHNKGLELEQVASEHLALSSKVLNFLEKSGIEPKYIQTSGMQFGENREYIDQTWVKEGYFASTDIVFELVDLEKYQALWIGLSKFPHTSVNNVSYDHSDRIRFQNESREKAVLAAKEKANALAGAMGTRIGAPLLIEEDLSVSEGWRYGQVTNNLRVSSGSEAGTGTGLSAGKIDIQTRVKVAFQLITLD